MVQGQTVRPAFSLIREGMKPYTPEWAEKITTIPAETIRTITREFVDHAMIGGTIDDRRISVPLPAGTVQHLGPGP